MKFPRNARVFRGQLDAAPFATVLFLLLIFLMLSSLVYTPGVRVQLQLPVADGLPGAEGPMVAVAMDRAGQLFFQNQMVTAEALQSRLEAAVKGSSTPLTLVVQMDRRATEEDLVKLRLLATRAGIEQMQLATLPSILPENAGDALRSP